LFIARLDRIYFPLANNLSPQLDLLINQSAKSVRKKLKGKLAAACLSELWNFTALFVLLVWNRNEHKLSMCLARGIPLPEVIF